MPVLLEHHCSEVPPGDCVHIGLINNMPDEALKATERQYISLLHSASDRMLVRLSFYSLPGVPRSDASSRHIAASYSSVDDLWDGELDGLIVTGREPLAANLQDEPYWESFTRTLAWAQENVHATVWSCLAAHAAVLHMDGISRVKRNDKLFGVFQCSVLTNHPLLAETPSHLELPHSRWNSLLPDQLAEAGYSVLTRTDEKEVDTFIRQQKKLFVFFQGHPEYEADTLLREYRRDIVRYFKGETALYPSMPQGYFDPETANALLALRGRDGSGQDDERHHAISAALSKISIKNSWRSSATRIYENWLRHIELEKNMAARSKSRESMVKAPFCYTIPPLDAPAEA